MKYYLLEMSRNIGGPMTAGIKAREDVETILRRSGYTDIRVLSAKHPREGTLNKLLASAETAAQWKTVVKRLRPGDTLAVQLPPSENTLALGRRIRALHRKGVRLIAVIHDLESVRWALVKNARAWKRRVRIHFEEETALGHFDRLIVHNEKMAALLRDMGVPASKLVPLGVFDYLTPEMPSAERVGEPEGVTVAGNLMPSKSGYVYELPQIRGCTFNLYGVNYEGEPAENVRYLGAFPSDELPFILNGKFGLVWDGPSARTCADVFGQYLRVNNPHKTSLYLAAGLPVAIWSQAALADFVLSHNCGIAVDSLYDLPSAITAVPAEAYAEMRRSAAAVGERLRAGAYLTEALRACE